MNAKKVTLISSALIATVLAAALWYEILTRGGGAERVRELDTAVALTGGGRPEIGYQLIRAYGCGACHEIPGIPGATGKIGPSLSGFKDRSMIAGVLANSTPNLMRWIAHPREIDAQTAMPDLGVSEDQARHVAAYLYAPTSPP